MIFSYFPSGARLRLMLNRPENDKLKNHRGITNYNQTKFDQTITPR